MGCIGVICFMQGFPAFFNSFIAFAVFGVTAHFAHFFYSCDGFCVRRMKIADKHCVSDACRTQEKSGAHYAA